MPILNVSVNQVGQAGVFPALIYILTNDTIGEVITSGYLNGIVQKFNIPLSDADMALVTTKTTPNATSTQVGWFEVQKSGDNWSLVPPGGAGTVILPTIANHIATYTNTTGTLSEDATTAINGGNIQAGLSGTAGYLASFPATAARGSLRLVGANSAGDTVTQITNASQAAARVYIIPDGGQSSSSFLLTDSGSTQTIATGSLALTLGNLTVAAGNIAATLGSVSAGTTVTGGTGVTATTGNVTATAGNVVAGSSGVAGTLISFPATAANGTLIISALNAGGAFDTTVRNSTMGQSSVISIPDPGAATANFLLDTGASNILAMQEFVSINEVLSFGTGTWTTTRIAQGNYVKRHTPGDETSIIGIDITPMIRTAASKGFRLDSFDVIYAIAANALDAHSVTLDRIAYADNVAVSVTGIAITATLSTATQANPYVTNATVDTPAFDNTSDSKYVIEVTVDNAAASEYDFYGIMLRFSQTVA
jgi:hypothetical protein